MKLDTTRLLPDGCYFKTEQKKDLVVLHFTAGFSSDSAITFWKSNKNGVSTPYIIDLDGTVYQAYDPRYWSYHLGIPKVNHDNDKRSVPIEIVSIGPLKLKGDTLYCWPGNFTKPYCKINETEKYIQATYRGFDHYSKFTAAQNSAIPELVKHVCEQFGIPKVLPPVELRGKFDLGYFSSFKGIAEHANFRFDKYDCGVTLDWSILENV